VVAYGLFLERVVYLAEEKESVENGDDGYCEHLEVKNE
jgi:hypothetical protein